jgi:HK97 family phage major capsid protein
VSEGKTVDQFRTELLAEIEKRNTTLRQSNQPIGLSDQEVKEFSFVRLIRALTDPQNKRFREDAAFELEVCEAARSHRDKGPRGTLIPVDVLRAPVSAEALRNIVSIKTGSGYTGTGENTVQTTLLASSYFELLRNRTSIMRLGTTLGGLVGDFDMPKQAAGAANAGWIGEDDDAPARNITFSQISLRPKTVAAHGAVTRKMLMQSSLDVEALLRRDLATCMAQAIDVAGYYGNDSGGAPRGIKETSGINVVDFNAVLPTWAELVAMETAVEVDNIDPAASVYVHNATMKGHFKTTQKFPATPTGATIWEGNGVNGYRSEVTNQIAAGDVFFGDFSELIIGLWGGLDIIVDPYTHSTKGRIMISNFQDIDFEVRRPEAFTYGVRIP